MGHSMPLSAAVLLETIKVELDGLGSVWADLHPRQTRLAGHHQPAKPAGPPLAASYIPRTIAAV